MWSNVKQCTSKNRLDYAAVTKITLRSQGHKTQRFTSYTHSYHMSYLLAGTSHLTISTHKQPRKNNSAWKVESQKYLGTLETAPITNCKPMLSEFYLPFLSKADRLYGLGSCESSLSTTPAHWCLSVGRKGGHFLWSNFLIVFFLW